MFFIRWRVRGLSGWGGEGGEAGKLGRYCRRGVCGESEIIDPLGADFENQRSGGGGGGGT
jgi:hypothetical protein